MKRRLRKKKRLGEFREYGFDMSATLNCQDEAEMDAFVDRLIAFVEAHDLGFGGGTTLTSQEGFVMAFKHKSCTDEDRALVSKFLHEDPAVVSHVIGALFDAWH